jgi:hypothetical protein
LADPPSDHRAVETGTPQSSQLAKVTTQRVVVDGFDPADTILGVSMGPLLEGLPCYSDGAILLKAFGEALLGNRKRKVVPYDQNPKSRGELLVSIQLLSR